MAESNRTEKIIAQFYLKALHAVLSSRIPHLSAAAAAAPRASKRDRWFNLAFGDLTAALDHPHHSVMEPLIIDIILTPRAAPDAESVVERWTAQCESPPPSWSHSPDSSSSFLYRRTYKKSILLLRSLYSFLRLLPAYRVFRMLCSSNHSYNYDLSYRVSSFAEPFSREEERRLELHNFTPVETQCGQLVVSVQNRPTLSDFNFEVLSLKPPMIITDYVGSPAADPIRAFPSSPYEREARPITFPPRGLGTSANPSANRPHSWTSAPSSSPTSASDAKFSHPDGYGNRISSQRPAAHRKGGFSFDEFKLSPPFSPSPPPSPPAHGSSYLQSHLRSETAPVSIPQPLTGRSQVHRNPNVSDPTRSFLPPPSPRSMTADQNLESRSFRKSEGLRTGDIYSNLQLYTAQKSLKDGRDDSGRFSSVLSSNGSPRPGFSRSSSRLSIHDDLDDVDFSCPFAVDDVDTSDSQTRNPDGKESPGSVQASSHKSQDAAVGILVQMLKTAPPLRQDHSYSTHSSRSELNGGIGTSSFLSSRKTSDALEELKSYKEIKEILLSQSGTQLLESVRHRKE